MPTYAYACRECGHEFEELQGFNDPVLRKCPECKKNKLERLISGGAGFIFKGDGFYETDYKKNSDKKEETKESTPTEKKSDSNKTESKKDSSSTKSSSKDKSDS